MSGETVALENKGITYCNEILYPKMGWDVVERIHDKQRQETQGDVVLFINGRNYIIDEKTASYIHPNMVIELIQDIPSWNMGWFHKLTGCDALIYMYFNGKEATEPSLVYWVSYRQLKKYIFEDITKNKTQTGITNLYYGCTLNIYHPWGGLIKNNIAKEVVNNLVLEAV